MALVSVYAGMAVWSCAPSSGRTAGAAPDIDAASLIRIPLETYQGRLRTVRVRAAGRDWRLLFDTGGGFTLVSPSFAAALGCEPRGRVRGYRMTGEPVTSPTCGPPATAGPDSTGALTIAGWRAVPQTLAVFDLMTLLPPDWPRLDGLISLRTFAGRRLTLDLAANALLLDTSARTGATDAQPGPGTVPVAGRLATGPSGAELLVFAGITIGTDTLWLEVDSGNLAAVQLAPHAARLLGMADSVGAEQSLMLPLAPGYGTAVRARVSELALDGALNAAWLEQGRLTLDLSDGRLWWTPSTP